MNALDDQKRKDGIKSLINIAIFEGFLFAGVIGVYFMTSSVTYLIGGMVAVMLISGPMFLRWAQAHGAAMKGKPNSEGEGGNG